MTSYYKILRQVKQADLNTYPGIAEVLRMIPSAVDGIVPKI